jgi:hypothetical protein
MGIREHVAVLKPISCISTLCWHGAGKKMCYFIAHHAFVHIMRLIIRFLVLKLISCYSTHFFIRLRDNLEDFKADFL